MQMNDKNIYKKVSMLIFLIINKIVILIKFIIQITLTLIFVCINM